MPCGARGCCWKGNRTLTDPYAEIRAKVQQAAADVAAFAMDRYRQRIEFACKNGAPGEAAKVAQQMHAEIDALTGPLVSMLARLPPPPMMVTIENGQIVRIEPC